MRNHRIPQLLTAAALLAGTLLTGGAAAHADVGNLQVSGTYRPAALDWNGDGNTDVLWYKPGASTHSVWLGTNTGMAGHLSITTSGIPAGNYSPLVGFFNGSAESAIFYDPAKPVARWCKPSWGGPVCTDLAVPKNAKPSVVDMDADVMGDILWYVPGTGTDQLWISDGKGGFAKKAFQMDSAAAQPLLINADDKHGMDILWYAPGAATDALWLNKGDNTFTVVPESINGTYQPVVGSFNDPDYSDDIFWYAPGAAVDHLWRSNHDGTWTSVTKTVGGNYQASQLFANGLLFINPSGADELWLSDVAHDPVKLSAAQAKDFGLEADLPGGVQRLWMHFKGGGGGKYDPGISGTFWYGPGAIVDQQWYGPA